MLVNSIRGMKIHPRGFYGSHLADIMHDAQPPSNMVTRPLETPVVETFIANKRIEDIFRKYTNGTLDLHDFDTAADVVSSIVRAFGSKSFQVWHAQQYQSPFFGDTHVEFIDDLLGYVQTGKQHVNLYAWGNILDRADESADPNKPLPERTRNFLGKRKVHPFAEQDLSVNDFVGMMLRHGSGMDSLILTAHILFCIKR